MRKDLIGSANILEVVTECMQQWPDCFFWSPPHRLACKTTLVIGCSALRYSTFCVSRYTINKLILYLRSSILVKESLYYSIAFSSRWLFYWTISSIMIFQVQYCIAILIYSIDILLYRYVLQITNRVNYNRVVTFVQWNFFDMATLQTHNKWS